MKTVSLPVIKLFLICFLGFSLSACFWEEIWDGKDKNPIHVVVGNCSQTIWFTEATPNLSFQQHCAIKRFARKVGHCQPILVSPCIGCTDPCLLRCHTIAVMREIKRLGYCPVLIKPTLPRCHPTPCASCVNLVYGKVGIVPPVCPNTCLPNSVDNISSNFGASTNQNLAMMIADPYDLLALPGDGGTQASRVVHGNRRYNDGKSVTLDMESSDKTNPQGW